MANQNSARVLCSFRCRQSRPGRHSPELCKEECYLPWYKRISFPFSLFFRAYSNLNYATWVCHHGHAPQRSSTCSMSYCRQIPFHVCVFGVWDRDYIDLYIYKGAYEHRKAAGRSIKLPYLLAFHQTQISSRTKKLYTEGLQLAPTLWAPDTTSQYVHIITSHATLSPCTEQQPQLAGHSQCCLGPGTLCS